MLPPKAAKAGGKAHAVRFLSRQRQQLDSQNVPVTPDTSPLVGEVDPRAVRADREGGARAHANNHPLPIPPPQGGRSRLRLGQAPPSTARRRFANSAAHRGAGDERMQRMTAAEAIVASLLAHGLDTVYVLPGVHNDHLFDALFKAGEAIRTIHTRHEQGAAYMALGGALATGKPQAYVVVPGPGLLNSGAAPAPRRSKARSTYGAARAK